MPSANKTPNIGLNNWEGNEYVKRKDFIDDNLIIDEKVGKINEQLGDIEKQLSNYNSYASAKDSNGIFTVVDYKRTDNTLYMQSVLSGGTSPQYTTDTWQFYNALGSSVIKTVTWTITYDVAGAITSKVVA